MYMYKFAQKETCIHKHTHTCILTETYTWKRINMEYHFIYKVQSVHVTVLLWTCWEMNDKAKESSSLGSQGADQLSTYVLFKKKSLRFFLVLLDKMLKVLS